MSQLNRSEAARLNGAKSHGPVTAEGKAKSSKNAIKHGLNSRLVVLESEDPEAFQELRAGYFKSLRPTNAAQAELVETLAATKWRENRVVQLETELFEKNMREAPGEFALAKAFERMCAEPTMAILIRYEGQLSRIFDRVLKQLRDLQKAQPNEPKAEPAWVPSEPELPTQHVENAPTNPTPPFERPFEHIQEAAQAA